MNDLCAITKKTNIIVNYTNAADSHKSCSYKQIKALTFINTDTLPDQPNQLRITEACAHLQRKA